MDREKGDLTQSYDKSHYTYRKSINKKSNGWTGLTAKVDDFFFRYIRDAMNLVFT